MPCWYSIGEVVLHQADKLTASAPGSDFRIIPAAIVDCKGSHHFMILSVSRHCVNFLVVCCGLQAFIAHATLLDGKSLMDRKGLFKKGIKMKGPVRMAGDAVGDAVNGVAEGVGAVVGGIGDAAHQGMQAVDGAVKGKAISGAYQFDL